MAVIAVLFLFGTARSTTPPPSESGSTAPDALPAEELRLDTGAFRAGLQKRGLTELLELHLRDFPPSSALARLLMARDIRLAEFADADRPPSDRRASIADANRILEQLIAENPEDTRQTTWRFTLVHSLLYDEAEPILAPLMYQEKVLRGDTPLAGITARALTVASQLGRDLNAELERVDQMPVEEFEQANASGRIRELEQLSPQVEYLRLWALFYDAVWRTSEDPARFRSLSELLRLLKENPVFVETPHDRSRVQVQSLLLAGMARRRSDDLPGARELLDRTLATASRISDDGERARIQWAITLALLERARCARDERHFAEAASALAQLRDQAGDGDAGYPSRFLAALTERSIARVRAESAARAKRDEEARAFRDQAWRTMSRLWEAEPARRDEILLAVFDLADPTAEPSTLDPFEQCAAVAGLLSASESAAAEDTAPALRAARIAEAFLVAHSKDGGGLVPEVRFRLAIARYRLGDLAASAQEFLDVAKVHPDFHHAEQAVGFAAQLSAETDGDTTAESARLRLEALTLLEERYPNSAAARAWRFSYATLLEDRGEFDRAAALFARIERGDDAHLEACFGRLRALSRRIRLDLQTAPPVRTTLDRRIDEIRGLLDPLEVAAASAAPDRRASAVDLVARARVILAEMDVLPGVEQFARALQTLSTVELSPTTASDLAGRVWRARLLAYERLGRFEEARGAIPSYLASDPEGSVATLQELYSAMAAEADAQLETEDAVQGGARAQSALLVAQLLYDHAERAPDSTEGAGRQRLQLQLAEAHLRADHPEQARELFQALTSTAAPSEGSRDDAMDARMRAGLAEAYFRLGDVDQALPLFNALAVALPRSEPLRWRYLLRDLQCRTARKEPPADIIKVIEQQRVLSPGLGTPSIAAEFEKLLRENQRRVDEK